MRSPSSLITALLTLLPLTASAVGVQVIVEGRTLEFWDVPQSAWFATYVRAAAEAGIVSGYKDSSGKLTGSYGPSNRITVAESLKIAVEGAGYDEEEYSSVIDSGLKNHWASPYVAVAKGEGFAFLDGNVNWNSPASRAEVAAIFTAAFHVDVDVSLGDRYDDVHTGTAHATSIEALSRDKIVAGDTDSDGNPTRKYRPQDAINRAEVAKMVIAARAAYGTPGEDLRPPKASVDNTLSVTYTADGFTPSVLHIKKGDTVSFQNDTTSEMWVASNPHPTHTDFSAFDAEKAYGQAETYIYTFNQIGTFRYHNHLNSSHEGTIVVE
ncbi:MAG: S-layer homology domain-containing protein [Candidatus Peregrinibacteria bacterium]|nr:S-layer homology domain-containing protein [Candidatus Peregrinibacteria bacterium]